MARRFAVVLAAALVLVSAFPGGSGAHTVVLTPKVSRTKVPKGALQPRDLVVIVGKVSTSDATCFAGVNVELVRVIKNVGERILEVDPTNVEGEYSFKRRVRKNQTWYVRFPGFQTVVAGHSHTCGAAASRQVRIRVQR